MMNMGHMFTTLLIFPLRSLVCLEDIISFEVQQHCIALTYNFVGCMLFTTQSLFMSSGGSTITGIDSTKPVQWHLLHSTYQENVPCVTILEHHCRCFVFSVPNKLGTISDHAGYLVAFTCFLFTCICCDDANVENAGCSTVTEPQGNQLHQQAWCLVIGFDRFWSRFS